MLEPSSHVIAFYNRHPISRDQILASVRERRGNIDALQPEDLYPHDQDHYGGLEAVDALAQRIGARPGLDVVDLCAGLGGPARYLAAHYGVNVVCVELNARRAAGARDLTASCGTCAACECGARGRTTHSTQKRLCGCGHQPGSAAARARQGSCDPGELTESWHLAACLPSPTGRCRLRWRRPIGKSCGRGSRLRPCRLTKAIARW